MRKRIHPSWRGLIPNALPALLVAAGLLTGAGSLHAQLYNNGPFVTSPGAGFGGADASFLEPALGTFGFGAQTAATNSVADDFVVPVPWTVNSVVVYFYQTGSTTVSTITGVTVNIWNGTPGGGGVIVATSTALTTSVWTNAYRVQSTTPLLTNRPIMANTVTFPGTVLAPGTYWLEFHATGSLGSGPWAPPITILGTPNTGNGLQRLGATWGAAIDTLSGAQQGFPFLIFGTVAGGGGGGNNNPTSTVLTSSKNPSTLGDSVTFRARVVAQASGFPSGNVQFRDGGTVLGNGTLNLLGEATFTTSALTLGNHTITAYYGGDASFLPSLSALLTQTVSALPTSTTTLTSSLNPSNVGQPVTLTATVAPAAATGTVTFKDGATTLGTGTLAGGVATLSTSALTAGSHALTAAYSGSASYQGSTSATLTQTVNKNATTTALASSKNPAASGESVTFTATVASSAATGTVTFADGATDIGSGTLSGGVATYTTSSLSAGTHSITASYGGDATYASSTSSAISQNVLNAQGCTSGGTDTLCVQNTRFRISVAWTNQYAGNQTGVGTAYALTSDSGDFTFFSPNNIELVVKVLDGTAVNGKYWVGYASLTDVGFTITVTDTKNSVTKTYTNPPGTLASATDTTAFAARPEEAGAQVDVTGDEYGRLASLQAEAYRAEASARRGEREALADLGACSTSGGNLCLNGGRFQLSVSWTNYNDGSKGTGTAIGITGDSGYFWFFTPPNVELMCKVLDGTAVNGKFWLLYGSLTDVQFTLTAKDTNTSATKTYENAAKNQGSRIDINAF